MKWFKRLVISFLIIFFFYILLYKPDRINLEGNWEAKEIVLDNKKIYPDLLAIIIDFKPQIIINGWAKSITIPVERSSISARLHYFEGIKGKYKIKLSSKEK